jgi:hypothetical protein
MSRPAFRKIRWIAFAFGGLLWSSVSHAADLLILPGSGGEFVRECGHKDVVISGSKSKFVLTGGCQSLSVPGDGNQILVDMASGSEIYLRGNENDIAWTKERDSASPTIVADGQSNSIVQLGGEVTKTEAAAATTTTATAVPPPAGTPLGPASTPIANGNPVAGGSAANAKQSEKADSPSKDSQAKDSQAKDSLAEDSQPKDLPKKKIANIDPRVEPIDDVKTGVLLDLHSAVSRTLRQCARGQRGDQSLCRYLISGPR